MRLPAHPNMEKRSHFWACFLGHLNTYRSQYIQKVRYYIYIIVGPHGSTWVHMGREEARTLATEAISLCHRSLLAPPLSGWWAERGCSAEAECLVQRGLPLYCTPARAVPHLLPVIAILFRSNTGKCPPLPSTRCAHAAGSAFGPSWYELRACCSAQL
jgi:hypothetical protein